MKNLSSKIKKLSKQLKDIQNENADDLQNEEFTNDSHPIAVLKRELKKANDNKNTILREFEDEE